MERRIDRTQLAGQLHGLGTLAHGVGHAVYSAIVRTRPKVPCGVFEWSF